MTQKKQPTKKTNRGAATNGALWAIVAIIIITLLGTLTAGGILPVLPKLKTAPPPGPQYSCCDSGEGAECQPGIAKTFQYRGETYGLLKSNILQSESGHTRPGRLEYGGSDKVQITGDNIPKTVLINVSNRTADYGGRYIAKGIGQPGGSTGGDVGAGQPSNDICERGKDLIGIAKQFREINQAPCFGLENDQIVYVCTDPEPGACDKEVLAETTPFDAYWKLTKNGVRVNEPVPSPISTWCPKPEGSTEKIGQEVIGIPTPGGRRNLQLETFQIKQHEESYDWLGAWCKPAVYLYPTEKTTVNVKVEPKGKFTLTIPAYPKDGWTVTAYPSGKIESNNNQTFPYLYYEAAIEDEYVHEPKEGFVVAQNELENLLNTILPKLGLSTKEKNEFSEYWLKALPKSPYYFVGIIPQANINTMAPLTISPAPDSLLRISLYFKVLDTNDLKVKTPQLTNFIRQGFSVIEWGGMVKTDKDHPFTCLM